MRIYYMICSVIATAANIILVILFRPLRSRLDGSAWLFIIAGFFLVLINNLIISFLVIERPRRSVMVVMLIIFFAIKPMKNILWLAGFWKQYKYYLVLENLDKQIALISSDMHKIINEGGAKDLVRDLGNQTKENENEV